MTVLHGNETMIIVSARLVLKLCKYRLYRVKLRVHERWLLLDRKRNPQFQDGLRRINNNFFVSIGFDE